MPGSSSGARARRPTSSEWQNLAEQGTMYTMEPAAGRAGLIAQMRRGALEYCVLALLAMRERYGFELVQNLGQVEGMVTSEGTIYPLLSRLRRDGVVETFWRESSSGPPRRYYRITSLGRMALDEFRAEWKRFRAAVDQLLEGGE